MKRTFATDNWGQALGLRVSFLGILAGLFLTPPVLAQERSQDAPEPKPDGPPTPIKNRVNPDIVIECEGQAYFNSADQIVVFEKDVVVKHPGFNIECEELEVFLKGDPVNVLGDSNTPSDAPGTGAKAAAAGKEDASDSVDKIFAKGNDRLVALTKFSADRTKDVRAKCGWATYDSATGDLILHDWPVLNQGNVSVQSSSKETIIYIRANGDFEASGPAIFQRNRN